MDRKDAPLEVRLINLIPLGDWGVVGSRGTMHVDILSTVSKLDEPIVIAGRFKGDLEISLMSVGTLVPRGDFTSIIRICAELVHHKRGIGDGTQEEETRLVRNSLDVPFEIGLIDPSPCSDLRSVAGNSTMYVQECSDATLDSNFRLDSISSPIRRRMRVRTSREEFPLEVGLIYSLPLRDRCVVVQRCTQHMKILSTVYESDEPESVTTWFEAHLEISLLSMGGLVPSCHGSSIFGICAKLMHNKITVNRTRDVKRVVVPRNRLDEPLQVGLVHPLPRSDLHFVASNSTMKVQESAEGTLYCNWNIGVGE